MIRKEILNYFTIRDPSKDALKRVGRAALLTAGKALKAWKSMLVMEYVDLGLSPVDKYTNIKEEAWIEFKKAKTTPEFKAKSIAARLLAKKYKNPHKMGTAGYAGMSTVWAMEDARAELEKCPKQFGHIKDPRARA